VSGTAGDKHERQLDPLLAGEIEKRLPVLHQGSDPMDARAALHSLRGSLALAGYPDLALVVGQHGARIREGDLTALEAVRELLEDVLARLGRGEPASATRFPEPPPRLAPSRVDPRYRVDYHAAMRDRLGELDAVLASTGPARTGLDAAKRSVHAMKGAAASVGDDVTAWYCHGLESRLRGIAPGDASASAAVVELARHRAMIALLLEDSARGIATLRALSGETPPVLRKSDAPRRVRQSQPPSRPPADPLEEASGYLRVHPVEVDRFFERIEHVSMVGHELVRGAELARQTATRLRGAQSALHEALRVLEPTRSSGNTGLALSRIENATATLRANATNAERGAAAFRRSAEVVERRSREMRGALLELRRTSVGALFARLSRAITRFADEEGKRVRVTQIGGELPIDRRVAERLHDALIQLGKNAVTHGIEAPEERSAQGKLEIGCSCQGSPPAPAPTCCAGAAWVSTWPKMRCAGSAGRYTCESARTAAWLRRSRYRATKAWSTYFGCAKAATTTPCRSTSRGGSSAGVAVFRVSGSPPALVATRASKRRSAWSCG